MRNLLALSVCVVLAVSGCGSSSSSTSSSAKGEEGTITVAAAASLHEVFTELGAEFEQRHPGAHVAFSFGSSGVLQTQIAQGAPADVFASADTAVMDRVVAAHQTMAQPSVFATNRLALVVRPGNPLKIASLQDLTKAEVVALCALKAPCGALAAKALGKADVHLPVSKITRGQDVKATLRQLTEGDADAAIVYRTDARTVGRSGTAVAIPDDENLATSYPVAIIEGTKKPRLARQWIDFLESSTGRTALEKAGFGLPD